MLRLSGLLFLHNGGHPVVVLQAFEVQLCNLFGRASAEDDTRAQALQAALADHVDGPQGIAAQFVEVVTNADLCKPQDLRHRSADGRFRIVGRGDIATLEVSRIRCRQGTAVQLSAGLERNGVDLHEVGRDHIVRQTLHQFFAQRRRVEVHIRRIIGTEVALPFILKAARRAPVDVEGLLHRGLDLRRFDAVAVDFDHIAAAAEQDVVAVRVSGRQVSGVIDAVYKRLRRLFRKIDIAADIGVYEAELAGFALRDLVSVLAEKGDLRLHLGLADGAGLISLVDLEEADGKTALAAGVDVDEVQILVVQVVRRLASHKQHPQEGACVVAELAHIRRRQEGDGDAFGQEELGQRRRILDGRIPDDVVFAAVDIQRRKNYDDRRDKIHRGQCRQAVLLVKGNLAVHADRVDRPLEVSVLMEHALRISRGARGIDGISRVVLVRILVPGERLTAHDVFPVVHGDFQLALAVLPDIVDALRSIGVLYQRPGCARLPHADHGDHRQHAARQIDQHKGLFSDLVCLQPGIDTPGHIVQLGIGDALGMHLIKEDRCVGVSFGVLLQFIKYRFHSSVSSFC